MVGVSGGVRVLWREARGESGERAEGEGRRRLRTAIDSVQENTETGTPLSREGRKRVTERCDAKNLTLRRLTGDQQGDRQIEGDQRGVLRIK